MLTNDMYNANTGDFDPRHMFGVTNQDVFRWPGIKQGTERMLLGYFITTILLPGIPLVFYGEEQAFYVLDSTAQNYLYGRQGMSAALAWKMHGCYTAGTTIYVDWPAEKVLTGCNDESVAYDHRDASHPIRNVIKHMFELRAQPNLRVLDDGWVLTKLANKTEHIMLVEETTATEFGIWSVARSMHHSTITDQQVTPIWLVYHNRGQKFHYNLDCSGRDAFVAPFDAGTTVKNLFSPYDEITLGSATTKKSGFGSGATGCIDMITMEPYGFRAYVPVNQWTGPSTMITDFTPGHDTPINSAEANGVVKIGLRFSEVMESCSAVTDAITIKSTVEGTNETAKIDLSSVKCEELGNEDKPPYAGAIASRYSWTANLIEVADGIHSITVKDAKSKRGSTGSTDRFLIRVGQMDNPIVFPFKANFSSTLLEEDAVGDFYVNHRAPGASKWRYSTNWGSSWSPWGTYKGGMESRTKINILEWSGAKHQEWQGVHVMVQYWSEPLGSSSFLQRGDSYHMTRRFPHLSLQGPFNKWGFDTGIPNKLNLVENSTWELHYMDEWPATFQFNVWGVNPDGQPDQSWVFGDMIDGKIANRFPPHRLPQNVFNISGPPPMPALSYRLTLDDATYKVQIHPQGDMRSQIALFIVLAILPVIIALLATWVFYRSFYQVKINRQGFTRRHALLGWPWGIIPDHKSTREKGVELSSDGVVVVRQTANLSPPPGALGATEQGQGPRKTVLLATMEYNIEDWDIVIRIGGLGVMAKLMSFALSDMDVIWVVPCVGDIEYPIDTIVEPMSVTVLGQQYEVQVQLHKPQSSPGNNITYVLLDAPIFRKQTKGDPYHARMDDIESAILYATWNACIAETMRRFPQIDIYHMNDYHGAAAPLYLLQEGRTIPCCLSLHNAEFQGMWNMRTPEETKEVCDVFGLSQNIVKAYVQYGNSFNLLHAGASYLRVHQRGFGAVGVSKKYGDRSLARYPIFWALKVVGHLPNPDPTDTAEWKAPEPTHQHHHQHHHRGGSKFLEDIGAENARRMDPKAEQAKRRELKVQAQEWAGLEQDPEAELFVFAGRWSHQKGIDLIADIFPSILQKYPSTQLICVGPVIGKKYPTPLVFAC